MIALPYSVLAALASGLLALAKLPGRAVRSVRPAPLPARGYELTTRRAPIRRLP